MAIQQCERCGADLPPTAPGASVTCGYCGVEQRVSVLPPPASPQRAALPAIARVDPMRARALFELFVREIQGASGVDVRAEGPAVERLVRAAATAVSELDASGESVVNLPFLTATPAGPVHYERRVTRADLEAVPQNPFGPKVVVAQRYMTGDEIRSQLRDAQERANESRRSGSIFGVVLLVVILGVVGIGIAVASSNGELASPTAATTSPATTPPVPEPPPPPKTPADADREDAWVTLPAERLPEGFTRFDPVAKLPWAIALAQEWAPDASLEALYVERVRADGTLDASVAVVGSGEPDADYRFVSAARRAQAAERIQVAENDVKSSFRIWVHAGKIDVMGDVERGDDLDDRLSPPLEPHDCGLAQVLAAMREHGLPLRPAWDLSATWDSDLRRWSWWMNMTDIGDAHPFVDATTCRVRR